MIKAKTFWYVFKKSITSFSYYKEIIKTSFSFSLKYLFILLFIVSLLSGLRFSFQLATYIPKIPSFVNDVKKGAENLYPKELIVKIENGEVSTNVKEPYFIDTPVTKDSHFVTIDTKAKAEDILKYKTLILVTRNSIVSQDKNASYRVYPLKDINQNTKEGTLIIDKNGYDNLIAKVLPYLNYLPALSYALIILSILVWPFLGTVFSLLGKLIYLLFITAIVWVIVKIMKSKFDFKKIYQMGMHAITIPVIIVLIFNLLDHEAPFLIPSIILIVFLARASTV